MDGASAGDAGLAEQTLAGASSPASSARHDSSAQESPATPPDSDQGLSLHPGSEAQASSPDHRRVKPDWIMWQSTDADLIGQQSDPPWPEPPGMVCLIHRRLFDTAAPADMTEPEGVLRLTSLHAAYGRSDEASGGGLRSSSKTSPAPGARRSNRRGLRSRRHGRNDGPARLRSRRGHDICKCLRYPGRSSPAACVPCVRSYRRQQVGGRFWGAAGGHRLRG